MALAFPVTVTGAEVAERALGRVGDAAVQAERRTQSAGRGVASFASQTEKLDKVVYAVEKPMRALNGALDIASVALGVGLAGPLGVVVGQLIEFSPALLDAARSVGILGVSSAAIATDIRNIGVAAKSSEADVTRLYSAIGAGPGGAGASAAQRALVERAGLAAGALSGEIEDLRKGIREAIATQQEAQRRIDSTTAELRRTDTLATRSRSEGDALRTERQVATEELRAAQVVESGFLSQIQDRENKLEALRLRSIASLGGVKTATTATTAVVVTSTQATLPAIKASTARAAATREETSSVEGLRKALTAIDPLVKRAGEDARTARLVAGVESGRVPVTDGLFPSSRSTADVLSQGADAFGPDDPTAGIVPQATAAEQSLQGTLSAATDLSTLGVGALQQFSAAAGQALSSLIIDGDATGKSLRKVAGEVTASLSATALGYAVFLSALGAAATLMGPSSTILGFSGPQLLTAAAVMGGTGVALGLTARALGAGSSRGSARPSSGGASGGGGDRVGSLSSGRPGGAQPVMVTVVLGVEQVTSVLVDGARREARAGGLSGGRLAVA
jgi:hypothetical protein